MPLASGTRLSAYEIIAPIGAGGMGEVYRARDTKLNRDVAIKVLPELFALDRDRLARFEREAQAVAALSHPNILAIHDFGSAGRTTYAVMELLDGQTLRDRLSEGPLSTRKAVDTAVQIARGLSAAHDRGIVHRDLKPENVFITSDGQVKILDFGLARYTVSIGSPSDQTVAVGTEPGIVMGTVRYMSPEQVRGGVVDHRSDIFSFGAVLYEMLIGQPAFHRDTAAETMTAILKEEPPELAESGRALPPAIDHVLRHCLEKRVEERFQSARDLGFALQHLESGTAPVVPAVARKPPMFWVVPAIVAAASALAFFAGRWTKPVTPHQNEWRDASFSRVTIGQEAEEWPALAPDGKSVAYSSRVSGNTDIYVQRIGGHNPVNLTKDSSGIDDQPTFSPDGSRIAFRSTREGGGIFVMGATGESVRRIADFGHTPAWSPDGRFIVVSDTSFEIPESRPAVGKLWVVALNDGSKRELPTGDAVHPSWSPDGTRIAYWAALEGGQRDIFTIAADGSGPPVPLTNDSALDWNPVWSPDGRSVYFASDRRGTMSVWRIAVDQRSGRASGEPESVVVPAGTAGWLSMSGDGKTMLYSDTATDVTLFAGTFDRSESRFTTSPRVVLDAAQRVDYIDVSPDGRWVAFGSADRQEDLFLVRTDGTGFRQITDDEHRDRGPRWSPDGSRLAFYSNRQGPYAIWSIRPDGSRMELLARTADRAPLIRPTWTPDGRRLFAKDRGRRQMTIVDLGAPMNARVSYVAATEGSGYIPQAWSPDGRLLAGTVEEGAGSDKIYLYSEGAPLRPVHTAGAQVWEGSLAWLGDSRHLLFTTRGSGIMLLDISNGTAREVRPRPRGLADIPVVSAARDGRTIAFSEVRMDGDLWIMVQGGKP